MAYENITWTTVGASAYTSVSPSPMGSYTTYTPATKVYQYFGERVPEIVGRYLEWHPWHRSQVKDAPTFADLHFAASAEQREYDAAEIFVPAHQHEELRLLHREIIQHIERRTMELRAQALYNAPTALIRKKMIACIDAAEKSEKPQRVLLPNVQYAQGMARPHGWRPVGKHPGYRRLVIA